MRRLVALVAFSACELAGLVAACTPAPLPPPGFVDVPTQAPAYDAGSDPDGKGTLMGAACAELVDAGCPEGTPLLTGRTCYQHLMTLSAVADVPAACLADAGSPASQDAIRACGGANQVRFRCHPAGSVHR